MTDDNKEMRTILIEAGIDPVIIEATLGAEGKTKPRDAMDAVVDKITSESREHASMNMPQEHLIIAGGFMLASLGAVKNIQDNDGALLTFLLASLANTAEALTNA